MQITRLRTLTLSKENSIVQVPRPTLWYLSRAFVATLLSLAFAAPALAQTYTAIDVPGYPYTHAFGINDFGSIVGDCDFADGYVSAYVLRRGNFTIIDAPGAVATSAWDINNLGVIVGDYYGEDYLYHGFLYVDGKLTTIDFPGAVHTSAQGIDDFGRIVGIFIDDTIRGGDSSSSETSFGPLRRQMRNSQLPSASRARKSWATWRSTAFQAATS